MTGWIIYTVVGRVIIMGLIGWEIIKQWRQREN